MNNSNDVVESSNLARIKGRRWRLRIAAMLGVVLAASWFVLWVLSNTKIKIEVSQETTRETEPLRSDGWLDLPKIINGRLSEGVSSEDNAAIDLWHALGPSPGGVPIEFHERLCGVWGVEPLPIVGDYFVTFQSFMRSNRQPDVSLPTASELADEIESATQAPWRIEEFPDLARWLDANRGPLELVRRAVMKPKYFRPIVVEEDKLLMEALLPDVQIYRSISDALCSRAMLRAASQDLEETFADIATLHHLARHVSHGGFLMEFMVALSIQRKAYDCEARLLTELMLNAEQAQRHRERLATVAAFRQPADLLDFADRFMVLDSAHAILVERTDDTKLRDMFSRLLWRLVDWSPALVEIQLSIDQAVETLRADDLAEFDRRREDLEKSLSSERLRNLLGHVGINDFVFRRRELAKRMGRGLAAELMPAFQSIRSFTTGNQTRADMLRLSYALLEYHVRNGQFPEQVDRLVPNLLEKLPLDGFTGRPFLVALTENSFVIRSVGADGVAASENSDSSDDIVVEFDAALRSAAEQIQEQRDH